MVKNKNHHLIKRGDTWYLVIRKNGKLARRALSQSLTEARLQRDEYLKEPTIHGDIQKPSAEVEAKKSLFGEIAQRWAKITEKKVKKSTMRDYRIAMNSKILPVFGNSPISEISYLDIEEFITGFDCSPKRINNILVPFRGVFKLAYRSSIIDKNVMAMIENRKIDKPQIKPLSFDEVSLFLKVVDPFYRPFFEVAFFTGLRGGEMAALKWENVDFEKKQIKIVETRVYGEEGRPKTNSSYRTLDMLPMVLKALQEQASRTRFKGRYVFVNKDGCPIDVSTLRKNAWTAGLISAKIDYRPMIQTRHTFATLMISSGEQLGWVQRMMGHSSLKMIIDKYYAHIPNVTHDDGSMFSKMYDQRIEKKLPKSIPNE